MNRLFLKITLADTFGRTHGTIIEEVPEDCAFHGEKFAPSAASPMFVDLGADPFSETVARLKVREFRREALKVLCRRLGGRLADYLEDKEGWHGLDRQEAIANIENRSESVHKNDDKN